MEQKKRLRARQFKKNEALNEIRKIYNPKYKFPYSNDLYGDWENLPSCAEEREIRIRNIILQLEEDLKTLK